jgi:hypothetical protein
MRIDLGDDEIAYLCGNESTVAIALALGKIFYLETEVEEVAIFTERDDLIVASTFRSGQKALRGLRCTIFQIRELESPLIVLPKGHPASPRLKVVVSIGPKTRLCCGIQAGTHPEQDVLCGSGEFEGLEILSDHGGALAENFTGKLMVEKL